ncbi:MAG: hypothetical protein GC162_12020, partial [Planctomycetes bacterium]|nr:hypothetical protein [Planctomycetota bacterium]
MANRLELIDAYLDGVLDDEVVRQLEADLVADPALARQLAQRSLFHARLRDLYLIDRRTAPAAAPTLSGASPRSVWYKKGIRGQGSGISFKAGVAFAALLLIAAALLYVFVPSTPHSELPTPHVAAPVTYAMLSDVSPDAQFADTDHALGSDLAGPIKLVSGKAQLMFKSAAVVDLTGPCEFEMTGVNRGRLMRGGLSA